MFQWSPSKSKPECFLIRLSITLDIQVTSSYIYIYTYIYIYIYIYIHYLISSRVYIISSISFSWNWGEKLAYSAWGHASQQALPCELPPSAVRRLRPAGDVQFRPPSALVCRPGMAAVTAQLVVHVGIHVGIHVILSPMYFASLCGFRSYVQRKGENRAKNEGLEN